MTVRWCACFLVVLAALAGPAHADTERRVALIIGNDSYKSLKTLDNAVNDARAMERELKAAGFETTVKTNVGRREMNGAINDFTDKLASGAVGLFYYAGHGIEAKGQNFLVPVDAVVEREVDLASEAVNAGSLVQAMKEAHNKLNIVILDACRDNPLKSRSGSRGLAVIPSGGAGLFVAYAAAPGEKADDGGKDNNGVFTGELVKALREPGLKIEDVFKRVTAGVQSRTGGRQVPYISASISGDFYFRPPSPVAPVVRNDGGVGSVAVEMAFWQSTEKAGTLSAYQAYAKKYPQGQFIELAEAKIADLQKSQQASVAPAAQVVKQVPPPAGSEAEVKARAQQASSAALAAQARAREAQRKAVAVGRKVRNGFGVWVHASGFRYEGEFHDGNTNGYGASTWPDGKHYEGQERDGYKNGYGVHSWPGGERYEGEFRNDNLNGYGIHTRSDGQRYEGEFHDDNFTGQGVMTYPNGRVEAGIWRDGELVQAFAVAGGR